MIHYEKFEIRITLMVDGLRTYGYRLVNAHMLPKFYSYRVIPHEEGSRDIGTVSDAICKIIDRLMEFEPN